MNELGTLIDVLNDRGIIVAWAREMGPPGVWVQEHRLLVLSAGHSPESLQSACHSVLQKVGASEV